LNKKNKKDMCAHVFRLSEETIRDGGLILISKELSEFLQIVGRLKAVRRSGWISQVGIDEPESVADHSFRCAIIAMCIGSLTDVDIGKLVPMLLLHDIQEAVTGDFDSSKKKELVNSRSQEDPVECPHHFGFLKTLTFGSSVPEGCYGCSQMIECLRSNVQKSGELEKIV